MLTRQLASAGSGKTYTLAKEFIRLFISIKEEGSPRRPRTHREMYDSLTHILAITFTNKATNEMKIRIIDKLAALAKPDPGNLKATDYLLEFMEDFGCGWKDVASNAAAGLKILLNDFGAFNVSTIDSFFQTVLRTFAFEADLNDTYSVELNNDYISKLGVDNSLESINQPSMGYLPVKASDVTPGADDTGTPISRDELLQRKTREEVDYWVSLLMRNYAQKGVKFNVFTFRDSGKKGNLYMDLLKQTKHIENENFKTKLRELEDYFDNPATDMRSLYAELCNRYDGGLDRLCSKTKGYAKKIAKIYDDYGIPLSKNTFAGKTPTHIGHFLSKEYSPNVDLKIYVIPEIKTDSWRKKIAKTFPSLLDKEDELLDLTNAMYAAYEESLEFCYSTEYRNWRAMKGNFPFLSLLMIIRRSIDSTLTDNNSIALSNTNTILSEIIGESDTPFVYERLGTRLHHLLIDEFQDTSRMQWKNLLPLLKESLGQDYESLVIGDAKQSIYRFRNADSTIITRGINAEFSEESRIDKGLEEKDNTNWRSMLRVVQFNNFVFNAVARLTTATPEQAAANIFNKDTKFDLPWNQRAKKNFLSLYSTLPIEKITDLYANTVQKPHNTEDEGYVEINFFNNSLSKASNNDDDSSEDDNSDIPAVYKEFPKLIVSLLRRGYRQKDIAILVRTNKAGEQIINTMMDFNNNGLPVGMPPLRFVSEESLKLENAASIKIIISALESISGNSKFNPLILKGDTLLSSASSNPNTDRLQELISGMRSVALPAIIESVIGELLSDSLRRNEASYLAAFQDLVIEYCDSHSSDIASFLKFWQRSKNNLTIQSAEGDDAVKIMTVHKSKGLEFRVVILPIMSDTLGMWNNSSETRWVRPSGIQSIRPMPPFVPIDLDKSNMLYSEYLQERIICENDTLKDNINNLYVGFTRAVDELYIYVKNPGKTLNPNPERWTLPGMSDILYSLASDPDKYLSEYDGDKADYLVDPSLFGICDDSESSDEGEEEDANQAPAEIPDYFTVCYGKKIPDIKANDKRKDEEKRKEKEEQEKREAKNIKKEEEKKPEPPTQKILHEYFVNLDPSFLKFEISSTEENGLESNTDQWSDSKTNEKKSAAEEQQRIEGLILHSIMQNVRYEEDLHAAVTKVKVKGYASSDWFSKTEAFLAEALENVRHLGWFSPRYRVINERNFYKTDGKYSRPDRIMLDSDSGAAVIVDYKFGDVEDEKYRAQVKDYIARVKECGIASDVEGYIWYVSLGKIEKV